MNTYFNITSDDIEPMVIMKALLNLGFTKTMLFDEFYIGEDTLGVNLSIGMYVIKYAEPDAILEASIGPTGRVQVGVK